MELFLQTRGSARTTGYRFLGAEPSAAWWQHRYGGRTAFEHPTVLVEADGEGVRAYLGAIPSSRRDTEGATNRVTIVVESAPIADVDARGLVGRLVAAWVADIASGGTALQNALDAGFDEATVSRLYSGDDGTADEVRQRVFDVARALPAPPAPDAEEPELPASWIAPVRSATGRQAFLERVDDLLAGRATGAAVLVNLSDAASEFAAEADAGIAVLVDDVAKRLPDDQLVPIGPRTRPPAPSWTPPSTPGPSPGKALAVLSGTARRMGCAVLVVAIVVVVAITIVLRARSGAGQSAQPPPTPLPTTTTPAPKPAGTG